MRLLKRTRTSVSPAGTSRAPDGGNVSTTTGEKSLKAGASSSSAVGGSFFFGGKQGGEPSDAWGYYRELIPGRRIVFTWFVDEGEEKEDNSTVTLELEPFGSGSLARMSHEMDAQWDPYATQTAQAWYGMLEAIDRTLA